MTVGMVMASPVSSLTFSRCSSSSFTSSSQPFIYSLSSSLVSYPKTPKFHLSTWIRQLGFSSFQQWSGLKLLGISITSKSVKLEKNRRCQGRGIHASLFGVGAPEALVIGVVALLVFGPKGLAEVARNLGKTLRAFQPTIRELQDVSREFKSTLEREIGIDDIQSTNTYNNFNRANPVATPPSVASNDDSQTVVDPNGTPSPERAYTSEDYLKITEEQLKASATQQQASSPPQGESQLEPKTQSQATTTDAVSPPRNPET